MDVKHIWINGKQVPLYDQNPYFSRQEILNGASNVPQSNDRITIKHLPLSVSNTSVKHMLEERGVKLMSPIMYSNIRDGDGQLTDFKSGDRFVYVSILSTPLPRQHQVGSIQCLLFHHGQDITCSACGEKGHRVRNSECKAKPKENITAFRSYEHTLSNHYPCQIKIWDTEFKSLEHVFLGA